MGTLIILKLRAHLLGWIGNRLEASEHRFNETKWEMNRKHQLKHMGKKRIRRTGKNLRYLGHNQMV